MKPPLGHCKPSVNVLRYITLIAAVRDSPALHLLTQLPHHGLREVIKPRLYVSAQTLSLAFLRPLVINTLERNE